MEIKQQGTSEDLISEYANMDAIKAEGRKLAILDGCIPDDYCWVGSNELKNYELAVNNKYKFIIRQW